MTTASLYKLAPSVNVYVSYGRGFETPSFAELAYRPDGTPGLNFDLQPSTSDDYEAGLKADFGNQGKLRLALYKIDTDNEVVTAASANGRSTFQNAGATTRKGAELSLDRGLGGGFHGYAAWTWLQADFASGPFAGKRLPAELAGRCERKLQILTGVSADDRWGRMALSPVHARACRPCERESDSREPLASQRLGAASGWAVVSCCGMSAGARLLSRAGAVRCHACGACGKAYYG